MCNCRIEERFNVKVIIFESDDFYFEMLYDKWSKLSKRKQNLVIDRAMINNQ